MKICVTAAAGDLEARVHWEFGRSKYFVIVDPDTMAFEAVRNENIIDETGRAFCIAHPEMLLNKEVDPYEKLRSLIKRGGYMHPCASLFLITYPAFDSVSIISCSVI